MVGLRSGRFVAWGNALLAGLTSPDEAAERVATDGERHRLGGLSAEPEPVSLAVGFARLRAGGVTRLRLALPVPGDPLGLAGPVAFNEAATAAGEAVLVDGRLDGNPDRSVDGHLGGLDGPVDGLIDVRHAGRRDSDQPCVGVVPDVVTHGPPGGSANRLDTLVSVLWTVYPIRRGGADVPSLEEAERELAQAVRHAADALSALEVARWRPEAATALEGIRRNPRPSELAPGYPPRAHRVLAQAQRLAAIVEIASSDNGAALSAHLIAARAAELRPLARAARRAQVAAYNAFRVDGFGAGRPG